MTEYKKIVLLKGLENMNDYQFAAVKSLLVKDLKLTRKMQDDYNRIRISDLMEEKFPGAACVEKLIELVKDIESLKGLADKLRKEKLKVARKMRAKGRTPVKKNQEEVGPATPAPTTSDALTSEGADKTPVPQKRKVTIQESTEAKRNKASQEQSQPFFPPRPSTPAAMGHPLPAQIASPTPSNTSATQNQNTQAQRQAAARGNVLQKDQMTVMVLKATQPFEYESPDKGKNKMFHATVVSKTQFYQVKVFDINLKDKFVKLKIITVFDYMECNGILEINEASSVSEVGLDPKFEVPNSIIRNAIKTPKINYLHKQASGTMVYGLFKLQKKTVNKTNTVYEIQDNTGSMKVVGNGKWHDIKCEEGDKLRLYCFQLRTIDYTMKLMCGIHSFIKKRFKEHSKTIQGYSAG
ncbi:myeloid cell nuclear differentiation antigen isoform X2 [Microcebus murinus]|uniref:myeloid cell nuclear differentiation antigen isoform X2 n=1 Tax=Microcebus murinus TaxID=30608 RepID=UPI000643D66A|nr:myeloid cell nuclear differentiation antigen isoform X2 [Microcebus murinus]